MEVGIRPRFLSPSGHGWPKRPAIARSGGTFAPFMVSCLPAPRKISVRRVVRSLASVFRSGRNNPSTRVATGIDAAGRHRLDEIAPIIQPAQLLQTVVVVPRGTWSSALRRKCT